MDFLQAEVFDPFADSLFGDEGLGGVASNLDGIAVEVRDDLRFFGVGDAHDELWCDRNFYGGIRCC